MHEKTFYKVITELYLLSKSDKDIFSDKRLTRTEKKILEGYLLIRSNQNQEAYQLMTELSSTGLPYVEAQKSLLIGISLNNLSHFKDAEKYLLSAASDFCKLEAQTCLFVAYLNLFFLYFNLQDELNMGAMIQELNQLPLDTEIQKVRLLRCHFIHEMQMDNFSRADEILLALEPLKNLLPASDRIAQLVNEFMFYVKQEKFSECNKLLLEMKFHRSFHMSENFNFMKKLLDHLVLGSPIYLNNLSSFGVPFLWHQLKVIDSFEQGNLEQAYEHWAHLKKLMPETFQDEFKFNGKKCLFSLCLQKHRKVLDQASLDEPAISSETSNLDKLLLVLSNSNGIVAKGLLFELIWGFPPRSKDDLQKLARLVYEARSRKGLKILSRKNTYFVESIKRTKAG